MDKYYPKEEIQTIMSLMLTQGEIMFFNESPEPGGESGFLTGYGVAMDGLRRRLGSLDHRLQYLEIQEIKLREENVAVKDAWEQYQLLLRLAGDE